MVSSYTPPQQPEYINVRFHPPSRTFSYPNVHTRRRHRSPPPKQCYTHLHNNLGVMLRPKRSYLRPPADELPASPPRNLIFHSKTTNLIVPFTGVIITRLNLFLTNMSFLNPYLLYITRQNGKMKIPTLKRLMDQRRSMETE